jgi:hypothetical protein
MNTPSNKINIITEINEIFISASYEIVLPKCYLSKFSINIPELAYIYDVQYFYYGKSKSFNDNNPVPDVFFDGSKPNRLLFDMKDIPVADEITIKILTYEILENQLGAYEYLIPYNIADESFEIKHDLLIRSDFGVKVISYSNNYVINQSSPDSISLHSKSINTINYDDNLYIRFGYQNKPQGVLYRYRKKNSDFFILKNSFYPKNVDDNNLHEVFFILDLSKGITKKQIELRLGAINEILCKIRSIDKINMCVFSDKYYIFSESSVLATDENIKRIIDFSISFSPKGYAEIDRMMSYVATIAVPLGYFRSYFLFAGNQQYPMDTINSICEKLFSQ